MFVAMCFTGETIEALWELQSLLAILDEISGADDEEDIAVWHCGKVVCVHHAAGRITWLQPHYQPRPLPAA
jgi:hypothetical protein